MGCGPIRTGRWAGRGESQLGLSTMAFLTRETFLAVIVIVVVTPSIISREHVVARLRAGSTACTVPCDPSFPPSPLYLYVNEERQCGAENV